MKSQKAPIIAKIITGLILLYLGLPILATTLYSFSTSWVKTVLPEGMTFRWYAQLAANPDFSSALGRSLLLGGLTTFVGLACFLPIIFYANVYEPKIKSCLRFITVLPFTIPGIILVTGLIQVYQNIMIPKIIILVLALTLLSLPLTYQTLDNAFIAMDYRSMFEQTLILGDSPIRAFLKVILPNIKSGIFVANLLTFTTAFGEYVVTNILLGGDFETLKIYMYRLMQSNGQASSVLTTIYFGILAVISLILILVIRKRSPKSKITAKDD